MTLSGLEVTLQFNLSPGDVAYAEQTIPFLRAQHGKVARAIAVVDINKPQRTKIIDPLQRYPEPEFSKRVQQILQIAKNLKNSGVLQDIYILDQHYLQTAAPAIYETYLNNHIQQTHDYGGCALLSYLAGIELSQTPYVLHYDADMLLFQDKDYDWVEEAIARCQQNPEVYSVTPRYAPPGDISVPTNHDWPRITQHAGGWLDKWFSTRCFLLDCRKLAGILPLVQGRVMFEVLLVKYLRRGYPRSPEVLLSKRIAAAGGDRLVLASSKAWLLHPKDKGAAYQELLNSLQSAVKQGVFPTEQAGEPELQIPAWNRFLGVN